MVDQCQVYSCPFHVILLLIHLSVMFLFLNNSITNCRLIFNLWSTILRANSVSILGCKSPGLPHLDTDLTYLNHLSPCLLFPFILLKYALPISIHLLTQKGFLKDIKCPRAF